MPDTDAAGIFLIIASVCVVLLTVLAAAFLIFGIMAALEVRSLMRLLRSEAGRIVEGRRRFARGIRFAKRWLVLFFERAGRK